MFDFIVGGSQKAATTWLYYCLREHRQIQVPSKKMEWEYLGSDWVVENGLDAFQARLAFKKDRGPCGQVSVQYLADPRSAEALFQSSPNCKVVFILREPQSRLISAYYWYFRKGLISKGLNHVVREGLSMPSSGGEVARAVEQDLLERGCYRQQLEPYLKRFSPSQIFLLSYDQVERSPGAVWQEVQEFLGVASLSSVPEKIGKPKQNSYSSWLAELERLLPRSRVIAFFTNIMHQGLTRLGIRKTPETLSANNRVDLTAYYAQDLEWLLSDAFQGVVGAERLMQDVQNW